VLRVKLSRPSLPADSTSLRSLSPEQQASSLPEQQQEQQQEQEQEPPLPEPLQRSYPRRHRR